MMENINNWFDFGKLQLEQASTYEERRKIRARLRELMAEREGKSENNNKMCTLTSAYTSTNPNR